jgi:adenine specific DNA methylase Mod
LLDAFQKVFAGSDMMAYLAMMAVRLIEMRRVLKSTGSVYLHCDPTASHYLKVLLDAIFSPVRFVNEIIWKRYGAHSNSGTYGAVHDVLLFTRKEVISPSISNIRHMRTAISKRDSNFRTLMVGAGLSKTLLIQQFVQT